MAESSPDSCFKGGKFSAPGFRFHPTDEELVMYYLKRKICRRRLRINAIGVVDVYKLDPEDLPGQSVLKTGDRQWFFFTPRSRKYPNAARSSRGTATGYWKATGKDRIIEYNSRSVGLKKTLVFYRGRAPNGERTDWVMHEYTMDEDELGRCKNVCDYYALYKLFKKSGAGPKNGEQYGAPFQEDEWLDDDNEDGDNIAVSADEPVLRYQDTRRANDNMFFNPVNVQHDDIDELLQRIPDAPGVPPSCIDALGPSVPQGNSEEELQSSLVNSSAREFPIPEETGEFFPNGKPYNKHSSFGSLVSPNSLEATEVTSSPNTSGMAPLVFEKDDYIEMDDLLSPELGFSSVEKSAQFLNPGEFGDNNEFDQLFHEVSMSLDMEPIVQGSSSLTNFANNTSDQKQQFLYQQLQDQPFENKPNSIMDNRTIFNQFTDDIWFKDDQAVQFDPSQSFSGAFASPSSGVILPESTNPTMGVSPHPEGENGGGTSPFSSALWAFMDSIPSTPASACEGPLNRTFVRMSSFSRIRFNGKGNGAPVTSTIAEKRIRNRGFLILSIVGAFCAIFWVLITTVRGSGRPIF